LQAVAVVVRLPQKQAAVAVVADCVAQLQQRVVAVP
jgi:hypothetical protein